MMQPTSFALAFVLCLTCSNQVALAQEQVPLPSVDEVLDNFYEALGGEMAIAGMSEVQFSGSYFGQISGEIDIDWAQTDSIQATSITLGPTVLPPYEFSAGCPV